MQFVVIGRDATDAEAPARRQKVRDAHLALAEKMGTEGILLFGVALVNDAGEMCGSVMTLEFPDEDALDAWLRDEPYITGNVWDKVEISDARVAPSFQNMTRKVNAA